MFDENESDVLAKLINWSEANDDVRALILTSSRASANKTPDKLSDYDVEEIVDSLDPFMSDDWLSVFGRVIIKWPLSPRNTGYSTDSITRLVVFSDFPRIDSQIIAIG